MRQACPALFVLALALLATCPAAYPEVVEKGHPDYDTLSMVQSKREVFEELEQSCREVQELQECLELISELSGPLLPVLEATSDSKLLGSATRIPGIGKPIESLRTAASAIRVVLGAVQWVSRMDSEYQAPIRRAILDSERLLRSKDSRDVAPLLASYREACAACDLIEGRLSSINQQLDNTVLLVNKSVNVLDRLGHGDAGSRDRASDLVRQLQEMQRVTSTFLDQVRAGRSFMGDVLRTADTSATAPIAGADAAAGAARTAGTASRRIAVADEDDGPASDQVRVDADPAEERTTAPAVADMDQEDATAASSENAMAAPPQEITTATVRGASGSAVVTDAPGPSAGSSKPRHSVPILLIAALPGIGALLAIGWMAYTYYGASRHQLRTPAAADPGGFAVLQLGQRQLVIAGDQPVVLGRGAGPGSVFIDHPTVSAVHARVEFIAGAWWITDLASSGGTYVEGERISRARLSSGQRLRLASVEMLFAVPADRSDPKDSLRSRRMGGAL